MVVWMVIKYEHTSNKLTLSVQTSYSASTIYEPRLKLLDINKYHF